MRRFAREITFEPWPCRGEHEAENNRANCEDDERKGVDRVARSIRRAEPSKVGVNVGRRPHGGLAGRRLHDQHARQHDARLAEPRRENQTRRQRSRQLAATLRGVVCQRMVATVAGAITPALEIMINTATVKKLIEENRLDKLPAAIETANDDGMLNFNQALFQLVKDGKVSEQEALSKATNPQALEMNFKGIFLDEGRRILA